MGRLKTGESKVVVAQTASQSLRTTIPVHVVGQLGLDAGDVLLWSMDKDGDGWFGTIRKKK